MSLYSFHFLRPYYLIIFIPALIFVYFYYKNKESSNWSKIIDRHLLKALRINTTKKDKSFLSLCCFLFFSIIALSGPTYKKLPSSESFSKNPIVIVLELSSFMLATDISPNRLTRAKFAIEDILQTNPQNSIGLVVFAADAHVVTPITYDHETIKALLKDLSPNIMPLEGSNLDEGLKKAQEISSNFFSKILVITSNNTDIKIQDYNSDILVWLFNTKNTNENFLYYNDTSSQKKISSWLNKNTSFNNKSDISYDEWYDLGPYFLALSLIPFLIISFQTQLLLSCFVLIFAFPSKASITDWFLRPEQKSYDMLKNKQFDEVVKTSPDALQKGYAYYKTNNFSQALEEFKKVDSLEAKYNLGNTYAQMQKLNEAIDAYKQVLAKDPHHKDALFNKELLEKELEKQKQDQEQKQDNNQENKQEQEQKQDKAQENKQDQEKKQDNNQENKQKQEQKQDKAQENKQDQEKKQDKSQENKQKQEQKQDNNSTKYYFDKIEQNSTNYLKQKFLYETRFKK